MYNNMMGGMPPMAWGPPKFKNLKMDYSKKDANEKYKRKRNKFLKFLNCLETNQEHSVDSQPTPIADPINEINQI